MCLNYIFLAVNTNNIILSYFINVFKTLVKLFLDCSKKSLIYVKLHLVLLSRIVLSLIYIPLSNDTEKVEFC